MVLPLSPYTSRYVRQSGLIAWDAAKLASCRVGDDLAQRLHVAAQLEEDTSISARQARALGLDRTADIGAFLGRWEREEAEHGRAIRALLAHQPFPPPAARPAATALRRRAVALLPTASLRRFPQTALVFCALGAAGEYLAIVGYTELAKGAENATVESLLRAITRQEGRHLAFFLAAARTRAEGMSAGQGRVARRLLRRLWEPIGVASLGTHSWTNRCAGMLDDPDFAARVQRMDRVVDSIPHLAGLDLMTNFLADQERARPPSGRRA